MEENNQARFIFFRELAGKPVVLSGTGEQLGVLKDILIEPNLLEVGAINTNQNIWLVRAVESIPSKTVKIQNRGVILVNGFDLRGQEYLPAGHWLSLCKVIHEQDVVTRRGARLGKTHDIQLDESGRVVAYQMMRQPRKEDLQEDDRSTGKMMLIPVLATHALDSLVMTVNENVLLEQGIKI